MALVVQLDGAKALDDGIWKANLSPAEVRLLGMSASAAGEKTVVLLDGLPKFERAESRLVFDPAAARLLIAGSSSEAIFISSGKGVTTNRDTRSPSGDGAFLSSLPSDLRELGQAVLSVVRSKFSGELRFYPKSGRYVDTPDNFWTVKPQPRDISFRITVRGVPESFSGVPSLELKADQSGYSSFKISTERQLQAFARVLDQVQRK